jgi:mannitol operon transcriptional antiterminator
VDGTMLNSRATKILHKLFEKEVYVPVHKLAILTKSSDRSVRYNLQKIDEFLRKNKLEYLERHHLKGVKLVQTEKTKELLTKFFSEHHPYQTILSKEEIHLFFTLNLLINQKELPVSFFEKSLNISRTAVSNHLNDLQASFEKKNFQFHRIAKKGVAITGNENARILMFVEQFCHHLNLGEFYQYIEVGETSTKLGNLLLKHLFNRKDLIFVKSLIMFIENQLNCMYDDKSFLMLTVYFTRLINRSRAKSNVLNEPDRTPEVNNEKIYRVSKEVLAKLSDMYTEIETSEAEIAHLAQFILSMKTIKTNRGEIGNYTQIAEKLISSIEEIYQISFFEKRSELHELLLHHIEPMMNRIRFHLTLENPLYDEVIHLHKELFLHLYQICKKIGADYQIEINKQEVSYLTLHFASMMERLREDAELPKILVVCIEGIAISKYLAASIANLFNIKEIDTLPVRQINHSILDQYDLVVSTVQLPKLDPNKVIQVNSILSQEDIDQLKTRLNLNYNRKAENKVALVNQLIKIIQESCEIHDLYKLKYDLLVKLLNHDEKKYIVNHYKFKINFSEDFIKVQLPARDWKEAIQIGADILENHGSVSSEYGKKIIRNLEEVGPYMSIAPGVVLSHAGPEDGVYENSMSIVTLEKGVDFHDRFDEKVRLIITLALNDEHDHLQIVEDLIKLSNHKHFVDEITECKQPKDVWELLAKELDFLHSDSWQ